MNIYYRCFILVRILYFDVSLGLLCSKWCVTASFLDYFCQAQVSWREITSTAFTNTLVLCCRNIHVHLSLEAHETEGFCSSQTLHQLISLISAPSTGNPANHCNQLPVVFVWSENLDSTFECHPYLTFCVFISPMSLPPSWAVARLPVSCWRPWSWTPSSASPCSTACMGTPP